MLVEFVEGVFVPGNWDEIDAGMGESANVALGICLADHLLPAAVATVVQLQFDAFP